MEPFLEELKKKVLEKYENPTNVIVCPVDGTNDAALVQINKNRKCRILYVGENGDYFGYSFTGKRLERFVAAECDMNPTVAYCDNVYTKLLLKFRSFRIFYDYRMQRTACVVLSVVDPVSHNEKLALNLLDAGLIKDMNDLSIIKEAGNSPYIKVAFGVSPKYLRLTGLRRYRLAKSLHDKNLSPEEVQKLLSTCPHWYSLSEDYVNINVLHYLINNATLWGWRGSTYFDYLRMRSRLKNDIDLSAFPERPKDANLQHIQSLHDQLMTIHNRIQIFKRKEEVKQKTTRYLEKYYNLAKEFEFSNDKYSIIACKDLLDLKLEGCELNHCVGSYIDSVADGNEYILFLRKVSEIDKPFFTIDIMPNKKVRQIHGKNNCNITDDIKPFIKKWAKKLKLDITNTSGCLCHL